MEKCDKVITHGGTGAIIGAIKKEKRVIAIPRLNKYGEHVDNHQLQIVEQFKEMGFIRSSNDIRKLEEEIKSIDEMVLAKYKSNTYNIINEINKFIRSKI